MQPKIPNLPLGLRGKAGGGARVTAGPKRPHLSVYLWAFYFVPLIYISVFVPVPYCLDDCGFVAREKGIITIVYQTVGAETERMSRMNEGECFADVVGPLGNPSDLCDLSIEELKAKKILFIAGGVGTAPVYNQLKWLHQFNVNQWWSLETV